MRNIKAVSAVFLLCAFGVWGCGQQKTGAISARITELETRYTKLEGEHRGLQGQHDEYRKKVSQLEGERNALDQEKTELSVERDNLRKQITQRTQERDVAQSNLMQFSKDLQALAGRVEAALNSSSPPPSAPIIPASRRSE